jgi:hypothetical protein
LIQRPYHVSTDVHAAGEIKRRTSTLLKLPHDVHGAPVFLRSGGIVVAEYHVESLRHGNALAGVLDFLVDQNKGIVLTLGHRLLGLVGKIFHFPLQLAQLLFVKFALVWLGLRFFHDGFVLGCLRLGALLKRISQVFQLVVEHNGFLVILQDV